MLKCYYIGSYLATFFDTFIISADWLFFEKEERWCTLGQAQQYYLVVIHTHTIQEDHAVRMCTISARSATKHEIQQCH